MNTNRLSDLKEVLYSAGFGLTTLTDWTHFTTHQTDYQCKACLFAQTQLDIANEIETEQKECVFENITSRIVLNAIIIYDYYDSNLEYLNFFKMVLTVQKDTNKGKWGEKNIYINKK